jgi:hypothetical protein
MAFQHARLALKSELDHVRSLLLAAVERVTLALPTTSTLMEKQWPLGLGNMRKHWYAPLKGSTPAGAWMGRHGADAAVGSRSTRECGCPSRIDAPGG